jgi:hypothetical protein
LGSRPSVKGRAGCDNLCRLLCRLPRGSASALSAENLPAVQCLPSIFPGVLAPQPQGAQLSPRIVKLQ